MAEIEEGIVFGDASRHPSDSEIAKALGRSGRYWVEIKEHVIQTCKHDIQQWSYHESVGWVLRLKDKRRAIVYLFPRAKNFRTRFVFGDKAVRAAQESTLPQEILDALDRAKRYPEGRLLEAVVKTKKDFEILKELVRIKVGK